MVSYSGSVRNILASAGQRCDKGINSEPKRVFNGMLTNASSEQSRADATLFFIEYTLALKSDNAASISNEAWHITSQPNETMFTLRGNRVEMATAQPTWHILRAEPE